MRKGYLILALSAAVFTPFAVNKYFNSMCPELPKDIVITKSARAMPSFARQTGFSCSTCHTIPPRLNSYGRVFKMRGYTDGKAIGSISTGKGETILKYNPVSVRVFSVPYSKAKGGDREVIIPDEFVISFAGRVAENVGAFATLVSEEGHAFEPEIMKVAFVKDFGNTIVGIVGGKTSPTGTDPFESLNLYSRITRTRTPLWESVRKKSISDLWDLKNYGASVYAYIANTFYVNAGIYTGTVRKSDGNSENKGKADPFDFYGRVAFTPQLPVSLNVGAFLYSGKDEDPNTNQTLIKPKRYGIDAGVIYNMGDIGIELTGIYVSGKDKPSSGNDFKHSGYNLSATVYWKYRLGLSLLYGEYKYENDNPLTGVNESGRKRKDTTLNISYLLRPNVRLAAEYTTYNYSWQDNSHLTSLILDFAF